MANYLTFSNFTKIFQPFNKVKISDIISQMGGLADTFLSKHASKLSKKFKSLFIEMLILFVVVVVGDVGDAAAPVGNQ